MHMALREGGTQLDFGFAEGGDVMLDGEPDGLDLTLIEIGERRHAEGLKIDARSIAAEVGKGQTTVRDRIARLREAGHWAFPPQKPAGLSPAEREIIEGIRRDHPGASLDRIAEMFAARTGRRMVRTTVAHYVPSTLGKKATAPEPPPPPQVEQESLFRSQRRARFARKLERIRSFRSHRLGSLNAPRMAAEEAGQRGQITQAKAEREATRVARADPEAARRARLGVLRTS